MKNIDKNQGASKCSLDQPVMNMSIAIRGLNQGDSNTTGDFRAEKAEIDIWCLFTENQPLRRDYVEIKSLLLVLAFTLFLI